MSMSNLVLKGSLTMLALRFVMRGSGLFSMLVLARLLTPEDFGVVAIVSLVIFLFDIISETGTQEYLIQKENVTTEDLNSAWTLNLILKSVVFVVFLFSVDLISRYFGDPSLKNPLYVISVLLLVNGFFNPAIALYAKDLDYSPMFKMAVIEKMLSISVVIPLAFVLRNYWAMIVGLALSYSLKTILSFVYHNFRPRIGFQRIREQWDFSKWIVAKGFLGYFRAQFDTLLVSKNFGTIELGGYNMMKNLSALPAYDIVAPATSPLLSSFSRNKNDLGTLTNHLHISLFIICLLIVPVAAFMIMQHELITLVILGEQWVDYSGLLSIMSVLLFTFSFSSIFQHFFRALG